MGKQWKTLNVSHFLYVGTQAEHDNVELAMEEKPQPILHDAIGSVILKEGRKAFY